MNELAKFSESTEINGENVGSNTIRERFSNLSSKQYVKLESLLGMFQRQNLENCIVRESQVETNTNVDCLWSSYKGLMVDT